MERDGEEVNNKDIGLKLSFFVVVNNFPYSVLIARTST